jgi:hypothetical protein
MKRLRLTLALALALLAVSASANTTHTTDYGDVVSRMPRGDSSMLVCLNIDTGELAFCVPIGNGQVVACQ